MSPKTDLSLSFLPDTVTECLVKMKPFCHASMMRHLAWVLFLGVSAYAFAQRPPQPSARPCLAFLPDGTNGYTFNTGVLQGHLRVGGKSIGLSEVVHLPTGTRLDHSMGLFGHYRVFSTNRRHGSAAWDWPSEATLRADGSVEVRWPSTAERPFELSAVYRWTTPDTLDLETRVLAKTRLPRFESFLGSYFTETFTNACVLTRIHGQKVFTSADRGAGVWQAFPRDNKAASIIQDGRWKFPPSPVDWAVRPRLARPLGLRSSPPTGLQAVIMAPPRDCFAVLTPFETEGHRSMYLSLFGQDLRPGQTARTRARLMIRTGLEKKDLERLYAAYLRQIH